MTGRWGWGEISTPFTILPYYHVTISLQASSHFTTAPFDHLTTNLLTISPSHHKSLSSHHKCLHCLTISPQISSPLYHTTISPINSTPFSISPYHYLTATSPWHHFKMIGCLSLLFRLFTPLSYVANLLVYETHQNSLLFSHSICIERDHYEFCPIFTISTLLPSLSPLIFLPFPPLSLSASLSSLFPLSLLLPFFLSSLFPSSSFFSFSSL